MSLMYCMPCQRNSANEYEYLSAHHGLKNSKFYKECMSSLALLKATFSLNIAPKELKNAPCIKFL